MCVPLDHKAKNSGRSQRWDQRAGVGIRGGWRPGRCGVVMLFVRNCYAKLNLSEALREYAQWWKDYMPWFNGKANLQNVNAIRQLL